MKKTLVLGASLNPSRYSNFVIQKLVNGEHPVVAVGKRKGTVAGVAIITRLEDFEDIDTITLYLNPENQQPYYDYIISLSPERVIFNPNTENPELFELLKEHQIHYEIACTLVLLSTNQY